MKGAAVGADGDGDSIKLPAPGLKNSGTAIKLLAVGTMFLLVALFVVVAVVVRLPRDSRGWVYAVPAALICAGLVGLLGYAGIRWGLHAAWCDVTVHLPPGRLVVEKSLPRGYRLDIAAADVTGVGVADQFHPSIGWEVLVMTEDLRVIRIVNGRPREELEVVAERIRAHLGLKEEPDDQ